MRTPILVWAMDFWPSASNLRLALSDIYFGMANWRVWSMLALQEIRLRYRRSTLGPLWLTLSTGVTIASIGLIWSTLFNFDDREFVPYLSVGFVTWTLLVGLMGEGTSGFIGAEGYIKQIKQPYFTFIMWVLFRNVLIFAHTIIVFVAVSIIYVIPPNANVLLGLMGFPLVCFCMLPIALIFALISTRFRDMQQIINAITIVLFFVTPIIYKKEQLGPRLFIAENNPLSHMIDLIRTPLLGGVPTLDDWIWTIATGLIGWTLAILLYARFRSRISYWL